MYCLVITSLTLYHKSKLMQPEKKGRRSNLARIIHINNVFESQLWKKYMVTIALWSTSSTNLLPRVPQRSSPPTLKLSELWVWYLTCHPTCSCCSKSGVSGIPRAPRYSLPASLPHLMVHEATNIFRNAVPWPLCPQQKFLYTSRTKSANSTGILCLFTFEKWQIAGFFVIVLSSLASLP